MQYYQPSPLQNEKIRAKAYEIWKSRQANSEDGDAESDWQDAIEEIALQQESLYVTNFTLTPKKPRQNPFKRIPLIMWATAGIAILTIVVWLIPVLQANRIQIRDDKIHSPSEKRFEIINKNRETLLQAIGGLFFFFTFYTTWRNLQSAEDKQVTERFSKAVELLSQQGKIEARIGGVYLLERIAKDSPEDHWTVMEVLTSYIQEKSLQNQPISADIDAAITVIGRRKVKLDEEQLNLGGASLRRANLEGVNLSRAQLYGTDFRGANLINSNLSGANLKGSDFRRANLEHIDLRGANLEGADLRNSNLKWASLERANLRSVDLRGALLSRATQFGRSIGGANLEGAILDDADFREAKLLTSDLVNVAKNWEKAKYDNDFRDKLGLPTHESV